MSAEVHSHLDVGVLRVKLRVLSLPFHNVMHHAHSDDVRNQRDAIEK